MECKPSGLPGMILIAGLLTSHLIFLGQIPAKNRKVFFRRGLKEYIFRFAKEISLEL